MSLQQEFAAIGQPLQAQMQRRRNEKQENIMALIQNAVKDIAIRRNLDIILNADAVVYVKNDAVNISKTVIEQISKIK